MAKLLGDQFRAAGIPEADIHVMPYEALPGDKTVALIVRWRSPHATKKPMLILGHMDVVEAKRADWKYDPFVFREEGGYFLGRGTSDMKNGDVATTMAAVKLMGEGFKPSRDVIFFYSGDEETMGRGATLGSTKWRNLTDAEFGLNADGGCGAYDHDFRAARLRHLDCRENLPDLFFHRPTIPAGTVRGRGPTMRSMSSPTRSRRCRRIASRRCSTIPRAAISPSARSRRGTAPGPGDAALARQSK